MYFIHYPTMLFGQISSFALAATALIAQTDATSVSFSNYFDFTASKGYNCKQTCQRSTFFQVGSQTSLGVSLFKRSLEDFENAADALDPRTVEVYKKSQLNEATEEELALVETRELEELDKRLFGLNLGGGLSLGFPKAAFTVSDVAWILDDLFKVSINFQTAAAAQLWSGYSSKCSAAYLTGLGGTQDSVNILQNGELQGGFNSAFQWSTTIVIKALRKGNYWCLPDNFGIRFEFNKSASLNIFNLWQQFFLTSYTYGCSSFNLGGLFKANFNVFVNAGITLKREIEEVNEITNELEGLNDLDKRFFFNTLWLPQLWCPTSQKLPLFCWPVTCTQGK